MVKLSFMLNKRYGLLTLNYRRGLVGGGGTHPVDTDSEHALCLIVILCVLY